MTPGSVVCLLGAVLVLGIHTSGAEVTSDDVLAVIGGATDLPMATTSDPDDLVIGWEIWLAWSDCTKSCGAGDRLRVRLCRSFDDASGQNSTNCTYALPVDGNDTIGYLVQVGNCDLPACPVDGHWGQWSNWSDCSATCGNGTRTRSRECEGQTLGGANCDGYPNQGLEVKSCFDSECPVDNEPVVPPPGARNNMEVEVTQSDKRPSAITLGSFVIIFMVLECVVLLMADVIGLIKFLSGLKAKLKAKAKARKIHDSTTELNSPLDVKEVNLDGER